MNIRIPNGWVPRPYQKPLWNYLWKGGKRAVAIWHRRAGKDDVCLHWGAVAALTRKGTYWHMLPQYKQGRKAIWNAINPGTGRRRIDDAFPDAIRARTNEQEMFIELINGSTWQVVGSDEYNRNVGAPPVGIVFSEWALAKPLSWVYLSPILAENDGWVVFITTPRGNNHAYKTLKTAQEEGWFNQVLRAEDTRAISDQTLADERKQFRGLYGDEAGDAFFDQEYNCSFLAANLGSYYGKLMNNAEHEGRIYDFEPHETAKVHTAWDIGIGDSTAIWWYQIVGSNILVLDYYEAQGHGAQHYVDVLKSKPYRYGRDQNGVEVFVPHDARAKEFGTGITRVETLIAKGLSPTVIPRDNVDDGINAVRQILPRCIFHKTKTEAGRESLREYKKQWDEDNRVFKERPHHDWASHGADAFRYLAMSYRQLEPAAPKPPRKLLTVGPGNEATLDDLWPAKRQQSTRI